MKSKSMNKKYIRILKWINKYPVYDVTNLMKTKLHLLDPQIVLHFDILKKQKLIKYSNYKISITMKGRILLLKYFFTEDIVKKYIRKEKKDFTIDKEFYENYLPPENKMIE